MAFQPVERALSIWAFICTVCSLNTSWGWKERSGAYLVIFLLLGSETAQKSTRAPEHGTHFPSPRLSRRSSSVPSSRSLCHPTRDGQCLLLPAPPRGPGTWRAPRAYVTFIPWLNISLRAMFVIGAAHPCSFQQSLCLNNILQW